MGDRIAVRFRTGDKVSPWLYSHWAGKALIDEAQRFADEALSRRTENGTIAPKSRMPADRLEPDVLMVSFVARCVGKLSTDGWMSSDLRLETGEGPTFADDNGDWEVVFMPDEHKYRVGMV